MSVVDFLAGTPIRIDRFTFAEGCLYYFLSHAHADHLVGLTPTWAHGTLICTPLTAALLAEKFGDALAQRVRTCEIGASMVLDLGRGRSATVTLVDANHCPGACMFLVEGELGTLLHTGDFRYTPRLIDATRLAHVEIDTLIVDSTFGFDERFEFLDLERAIDAIVDIVRTHPQYDVLIGLDSLGREDMLCGVSRRLGTLIVVSDERLAHLHILEQHGALPPGAVNRHFTSDARDGYIRIVNKQSMSVASLNEVNRERATIGIRPSGWSCLRRPDAASSTSPPLSSHTRLFHYVPYSLHSSYAELQAFVQRIRPRTLLPLLSQSAADFMRRFGAFTRSPPAPVLQTVFPAAALNAFAASCASSVHVHKRNASVRATTSSSSSSSAAALTSLIGIAMKRAPATRGAKIQAVSQSQSPPAAIDLRTSSPALLAHAVNRDAPIELLSNSCLIDDADIQCAMHEGFDEDEDEDEDAHEDEGKGKDESADAATARVVVEILSSAPDCVHDDQDSTAAIVVDDAEIQFVIQREVINMISQDYMPSPPNLPPPPPSSSSSLSSSSSSGDAEFWHAVPETAGDERPSARPHTAHTKAPRADKAVIAMVAPPAPRQWPALALTPVVVAAASAVSDATSTSATAASVHTATTLQSLLRQGSFERARAPSVALTLASVAVARDDEIENLLTHHTATPTAAHVLTNAAPSFPTSSFSSAASSLASRKRESDLRAPRSATRAPSYRESRAHDDDNNNDDVDVLVDDEALNDAAVDVNAEPAGKRSRVIRSRQEASMRNWLKGNK